MLYDFYVKGPRTKKVQVFVNKHQNDLALSNWGEAEFFGVLGRRVRDGNLPTNLAERIASRYEQHRHGGLFKVYSLDAKSIAQTSSLLRRFKVSLKSADALHLGLVQLEGLEIVTSDTGLATVAKQLALAVTLIK